MASTVGNGLRFFALILCTVAVFGANNVEIKPNGSVQTKSLGGNHVLTCVVNVADRGSVTALQWKDPRNQIIDTNYRKLNPRIYTTVINNGIMLFLNNLIQDDGGVYTCVATYGAETLTASVKVDPFKAITFVNAPAEQSAPMAVKYKIKCQVEAMPPPTVEWTRNDQKIQNSPRYTLEPDGLVINGVDESDDGEYKCSVIVIDTGEVKSQDIRLEVVDAPKIVNTTEYQYVTEGERATLTCQATGKPKPEITWTRKSDRQVVAKGTDGIYYIDKIPKGETHDYLCQAVNKAGQDERRVHLNVRSKPDILSVKNDTVLVNGFAQIQCQVYANPKPSVYIRKYGTGNRITKRSDDPVRNMVYTVDDPNLKHTVIATMNISKVELYDDGLYECAASNEVGSSVRNAHLTVEYKPQFDSAVNINSTFSWESRPKNLTCTAEAIPNATIAWYFNNKLIERSDQNYIIYGKGSPSTLQVTPRDTKYYGYYTCKAVNKHGDAQWNIHLKEAHPPGPVENFEFNTTTATSITFKIMEPSENGGLPTQGYVVQYITAPQQWHEAKNETWAKGAFYVIQNLEPGKMYTFRFAAINEVGLSRWSKSETRLMPEMSAPSEPLITNSINDGAKYIQLESAKQLELKWKIPSSNGADIDKYQLRYCVAHQDQDNNLFELTDSCKDIEIAINQYLSSYTIKELIPDTYYMVQLKAHNNIGSGPASSRFFKTSISTEPIPPTDEKLSTAVILYIVVAVLIALLVILDIFCFFLGKTGLLYLLCGRCCGRKKKNSDDKLGSETKDLISNGHKKIDIEEQSPMITDGNKKDTAVEYDVKKGTSRTAFVGKDSAV